MALTGLGLFVLIMVALEPQYHRVDGEKTCSCYTFENGSQLKKWVDAKTDCETKNQFLVAMETLAEWEFINRIIKNQTTTEKERDEWHIGLLKNLTTTKWTWINGKPLTIKKWQPSKPGNDDYYALIAKEWPSGNYGLFNSIGGKNEFRAWICEKETDTCDGICMHHNPQLTTTTAPRRTITTTSAESTRLVSTTENSSYLPDSTAATTVSSKSARQDDEKDSMIAIVASLGAVLFILVVLIVVVLLLRCKRRRGKGTEQPHASSPNLPPERQYESVQPVEAAKLLGTPDVIKKSPKVECEYAMVNKENRKPKKGDLLYAQLADFDDTNQASNGHKPAPYEPTVYADVVPSDVYHKVTADSSDPTYANVQSTGV